MFNKLKRESEAIVVSELWKDFDEKRLVKTFEKFGRLKEVLVARQPPWVAFVWFEGEWEVLKCLDGVLVLLESY